MARGPAERGSGASTLREEIGKRRPFDAPEEEAYLNLLRTHAALTARFARLFRESGLTEAKYNALRILRGHRTMGERGAPCLTIRDELVAPTPDVTRLVDGLVRSGLAERERTESDRRVVLVRITAKGSRVLAELDEPVRRLQRALLGHLPKKDLAALSGLLCAARASVVDEQERLPGR